MEDKTEQESGYETEENIERLAGTVDIYLTDIKYTKTAVAKKVSSADDYFRIAMNAAKKMVDQVGPLKIDENGIASRGVIIRHLVLPGGLADTAEVMRSIAHEFGNQVPVSLMGQYFPAYRALRSSDLNRPLLGADVHLHADHP